MAEVLDRANLEIIIGSVVDSLQRAGRQVERTAEFSETSR